jgi:hypothetical protein
MTDRTPFLTLVSHIQRSNRPPRKESQDVQFDLFCSANETIAALIVLSIVDALLKAGANLGTLEIQKAISVQREHIATLLDSQFPHQAEMRPRRS